MKNLLPSILYNGQMQRLDEIQKQIAGQSKPPVDQWKPSQIGEIDIEIDLKGFWFHEGDPIQRFELVKLFASILWFEDGQHFLVTPVEKLRIKVADVPFIVQEMELIDQNWVAKSNTDDHFIVSQQHPVELRDFAGQPIPYVRVRYNLWARLSRSVYYQWVTTAMEVSNFKEGDVLRLNSGDYQFVLSS